MNVIFFDRSIERFIASLEKQTIARVFRTIDLLELFGSELGPPHSKKIEKELYELRIHGKQAVRIFYVFRQGQAVLLRGFVKKSERLPKREIETARERLRTLDAS